MSYIQVVNLVFNIISGILILCTMQFLFFALVGIFFKKKFPKTKEKYKYGIIIPARNEEKVVGNLIKSVQKNNYPQDKLHIFVIAHNCTDKTAQISRELGATVYEYNNPKENTMGYAFRYLFKKINEDYDVKKYDGFFLFNADNILSKDYFNKMNDAFVYYKGKRVITSCRNSKNFGTNIMSTLYGLYFMHGCRLECRGRSVLGCSTRVQGTGYVISSKIVEKGWKYVTLTEDWEFSADQILQGRNIVYCDDAVFYDEQPTTIKVMLRQRLRWAKGHLLVFLVKAKSLLKRLFKKTTTKEKINRVSTYDILINILPLFVISASLFTLRVIFTLMTPLFMSNYIEVWKDYLISVRRDMIINLSLFESGAIIVFISERKRIKNVSIFKKVIATILWPLFIFVSFPLEIIAVFKKVDWKTIPHTDTTNFEKINN